MAFSSQDVEALAADIGAEVYIDIAKWHLYLREAHLHLPLAEKLMPLVDDRRVDEDSVTAVLDQVMVPIAGGKLQLSLRKLIPMQGMISLLDILEKAAD